MSDPSQEPATASVPPSSDAEAPAPAITIAPAIAGRALHQPGTMADPPPPGAPGYARPGTEPGGPSCVGEFSESAGGTVPMPLARLGEPVVAFTTPGDSVVAQLNIPAQGGLGQAPQANSSARLQQGGGTMPQ